MTGKNTKKSAVKGQPRKKRAYKKKKNPTSGDLFKISRSLPFPESKVCKLEYTDVFTLNTGAAVFGTEHIYRLQSIYDPDYTAVGHQPYGFDQLALIYNKYKVLNVRVEALFTDPSGDGIAVGMLMTPPNDGTTIQGKKPSVILEKQYGMVKYVNNTGSQITKIAGNISAHSSLGITKAQLYGDTTQYVATNGANPTLSGFIRFAACNADELSITSQSVVCRLKLIFTARFYEPIVLGQS